MLQEPSPSAAAIAKAASLATIYLDYLVATGAMVATFVASVMADDQDQRLRNGTFGALAGSSIGGLAAILNNQPSLLVAGFFGAAIGGLFGWAAILLMSSRVGKPGGRNWLEYYYGGFKSLRDKLNLEDKQVLLSALDAWRLNFSRMIANQTYNLLSLPKNQDRDAYAQLIIKIWLTSTVDIFSLIFKTLANKPEYQSRVTIIIFGKRGEEIIGKHWISYTGPLPDHKPMEFKENSIGYKVLHGDEQSPYFTTGKEAKDKGQDRGQQTYRPFYTFRLNGSAVLAIDWPVELTEDPTKDDFVRRAVDILQVDITTAIAALLNDWSKALQREVELDLLQSMPLPSKDANPNH